MSENSSTTATANGTVSQAADVASDVASEAKDQATQVGQSAVDAGQHLAEVAKDQAADTVQEAARQAKNLLDQSRAELSEQAAAQQQRTAATLRDLSTELKSMSDNSSDSGPATDLVAQAATRTGDLADWLGAREPGQLVDEVRHFARQRPGAFLAVAAGAGLLAGRLTRGIAAEHSDSSAAPAASPTAPASTSGAAADSVSEAREQFANPQPGPASLDGPPPVPSFSVPPLANNTGGRS